MPAFFARHYESKWAHNKMFPLFKWLVFRSSLYLYTKKYADSSFSWTPSQPWTGTCPTCKTVWPLSSQKWWFFKASWHRLQPLHHTDKENQKNRHNLLQKHLLESNIGHILVHWALYLLNPQYTAFVVYFDQRLSAAHSKRWSKF